MPKRKSTGKNTTMVVMVETRMGIATLLGGGQHRRPPVLPQREVAVMFSSSTIESSTSRPTPSASPPA